MRIPFTNIELTLRKADSEYIEINKKALDEVNKAIGLDNKLAGNGERPMLDPRRQAGDDQILVPITPIPLGIVGDVAKYSDVLRTIHQNLRKEIFRKGYTIEENFSTKCGECGKEYSNSVDKCDECGSTDMHEPDLEQKKLLTKYLKEVNDNRQDIVQVYEEMNDDLETYDDAYLLCIMDYYYTMYGELLQAVPVEFLRMDPKWVRLVADKQGRPGRNTNGDTCYVCPEHRHELQFNNDECKACGRKMLPAYYRGEQPDGKYIYYGRDEVAHKSKYNPSLTYGFSVIYAIWMKVITLMNMDSYMKAYYSKQRPPRGLLFVNTPNTDSLTKAWNWMLDQWKQNPHQIPPIAVEQTAGSKGSLVNFIDMMKGLDEMQYVETRNEMRRQIGAVYGVMPLFQADVGSSGGLNNEGLQITVTNRAIKDGQGVYDDGFSPWVCKRLGVTDYSIKLVPNEEQDEMHQEDLQAKRISNAMQMQQMGFRVTLTDSGDFEFDPQDEPLGAPQQQGGGDLSSLFAPQQGAPESQNGPVQDGEPSAGLFEGAPQESKFSKSSKSNPEADKETELIRENKKKPENQVRHKFKPAEWTHPNGHPRCIRCGEEQSTDGYCNPQVNKDDSPVTTDTPGTYNPSYGASDRRRHLHEYMKSILEDVTKEEEGLINKADPDSLRKYIEESLYTKTFSGVKKTTSDLIKDFILRSVVKGYPRERILKYLVNKGLPANQAENIYRTETHALRTKVREWSYKQIDPNDELKYKWIGPADNRTTHICSRIASRTKNGVSMEKLKSIIQDEVDKAINKGELPADYDPREYTPHFNCRHTFVRSMQ